MALTKNTQPFSFELSDLPGFCVSARPRQPGGGMEYPKPAIPAIVLELLLVAPLGFEQPDDLFDLQLSGQGGEAWIIRRLTAVG